MTNILEFLYNSAKSFPDKIALADDEKSVTFSEWKHCANVIGTVLSKDLNGQKRRPILVFVDRNINGLIAFMGVVASGNFYVPIDCKMPEERIRLITDVLNPVAAIASTNKDVTALHNIGFEGKKYMLDEFLVGEDDPELLKLILSEMIDTDPLYAIFTSGSTGVPKGVIICHRGAIDLAEWLVETFGFNSEDNLANQTPFYFDGSVKDIYICLKTGATLNVIGKKYFSFPKLLIDYLNDHHITSILWATSAIVLVGNTDILETNAPKYINKVFFAGEAMPAKQLKVWMHHFPKAMYVNLYGPTEVTVDCTYYIVDREFRDDEYIPIGRACRNKQVLILNENNELVGINEAGELCVRGSGVALGYYNNEAKTQEVFVQNPLHNLYLDIIYRTGDIVKYGSDGNIEFISRKDFQIKHMGNRIEMGEIESAVNSLPNITNAACIYDYDGKKIVLYYTTADGNEVDVINGVKAKIPKYMFPNVVKHVKVIPYNMNGKIDRIELKKLYETTKG